jgi:hypothetical protein
MSTRGFTPPPDDPALLPTDEGEPDTRDDEMAGDDAPEPEWDDDDDG